MKIEDLIQLLNNRLREFKLSRDYARMSGDLERMNAADKEIIALGDTLYQLSLLVDASKSAIVKESTLTEIITDGSVAVLGEYDITSYATDPEHEEKVMNILSKMGMMDTVEKINDYITDKYLSSPVTGEMIMSAAIAYIVDTRLMIAIMEQDSSLGTAGLAVSTLNPGNVGNNDDGDTVTYESWQEGVTAVAEWLSRHRISLEDTEETDVLSTATSTSPIIAPTATTTTSFATSTPTTTFSTTTSSTTTPVSTATSTQATVPAATSTFPIITPTATTTTLFATSTPTTTVSTTITATTTPPVTTATSTQETLPVATSTPATTVSTTTSSTTTPVTTATSTQETIPMVTSTSTVTTTTSVDSTNSPQLSPLQATTTQETATTTAN